MQLLEHLQSYMISVLFNQSKLELRTAQHVHDQQQLVKELRLKSLNKFCCGWRPKQHHNDHTVASNAEYNTQSTAGSIAAMAHCKSVVTFILTKTLQSQSKHPGVKQNKLKSIYYRQLKHVVTTPNKHTVNVKA